MRPFRPAVNIDLHPEIQKKMAGLHRSPAQ